MAQFANPELTTLIIKKKLKIHVEEKLMFIFPTGHFFVEIE